MGSLLLANYHVFLLFTRSLLAFYTFTTHPNIAFVLAQIYIKKYGSNLGLGQIQNSVLYLRYMHRSIFTITTAE